MNPHKPLIVVVGTTASGKSELAMELARTVHGQLLCADSRTIYRGMDVGTAKSSHKDTEELQHYGIDLVSPDQQFTAAQYKQYALGALNTIHGAGAVPVMVGGTGLYVDAVLFDYEFRTPGDPAERQRLNELPVAALQSELVQRSIPLPANSANPRHLIRTLETGGAQPVRRPLRSNTLILGLDQDAQRLEDRIRGRLDAMFSHGLIQEVSHLAATYGWDAPGMQTIGYQEFREYIEGSASLDQVREAIVKNTMRYAKRQRTWFRRNKSIHWLHGDDVRRQAVDIVTTFLNK